MLAPDRRCQQGKHLRMVHMGVKPQALKALLKGTIRPQCRRRPGPLARALGHTPHQQRRSTATVAEQDIELRMAVEHTAVDQRRHRQRLLGGETRDDVEVEALERGVTGWPIDARRPGVDR